MNTGILILDIFLTVVILFFVFNWLYYFIRGYQLKGALKPDEFEKKIHNGQLIDLRSKDDFKAAHIMGARSIPYQMFAQYQSSIRKDQPILLYDRSNQIPIRAALKLKKNGYSNIYWLKGGFSTWKGNIKKRKI